MNRSLLLEDPPWRTRTTWLGFALAIGLYLALSLVAAWLALRLGWRGRPHLALLLAATQAGMALPPLLIIAAHTNGVRWLGLGRLPGRALLEVGLAFVAGLCGAMLWGLVLLPFGIQPQDPVVPLFGQERASLLAVVAVAVIGAPLVEELLFRGFLFGGLRGPLGPVRAALVSAALFALIHFQPFAFPVLFLYGMLLALLYQRSRSLWASVVLHSLINATGVAAQLIAQSQGML